MKKLKYGFSQADNPTRYSRLQFLDKMKRNPLARSFVVSKYRAKKLGLKFTIQLKDLKVPTHCPILGLKLAFNPGKRVDSSYSIDRIDNGKGYVKGNVAIISWRANRIKNNLTPKEIGNLYRFMKKHKKKVT